jgi:hypothetical protein
LPLLQLAPEKWTGFASEAAQNSAQRPFVSLMEKAAMLRVETYIFSPVSVM